MRCSASRMHVFVQQQNMKTLPSFLAFVLRALLLIGGVEPNPGPVKASRELSGFVLEVTNENDGEETTAMKKKLLEDYKDKVSRLEEDLGLKDKLDATAASLETALCEGNLYDVRCILQTGKLSVEHRSADGKTPLILASERGRLSLVRYLVAEAGACVNARDNLYGRSALHLAAYGGHRDVVMYLVTEAKMDPSQKTALLETPLLLAAEGGGLDVIRFLVDTANVSINDKGPYGLSAVHYAARRGHLHVVKYLWEKYNKTPFGSTNDGWTPLHFACRGGHLDVVMFLVEECAVDKNAVNSSGNKAVSFARGDKCSAIKLFLS